MATENDPLLLPTWLQFIVTIVVAVITGIISVAATALLTAVGITKKFAEMEKSLLAADSERFHQLINVLQSEVSKSETSDDELSRRIGACEQEIHTLKDFKERYERERLK